MVQSLPISAFGLAYLIGLATILIYSKDKFSIPTYPSMFGSLGSLPLNRLSLPMRYRRGRMTYTALIALIYTGLCIIGPAAFKAINPQLSLGLEATAVDVWPAAVSAFLISSGAANDTSPLGRLEFAVRSFAHQAAQIPRRIRYLARAISAGPLVGSDGPAKVADSIKTEVQKRRQVHLNGILKNNVISTQLLEKAVDRFAILEMLVEDSGAVEIQDLPDVARDPDNLKLLAQLREEWERLRAAISKTAPPGGKPGDNVPVEGATEAAINKAINEFHGNVAVAIAALLSASCTTETELSTAMAKFGIMIKPDNSEDLTPYVMVPLVLTIAGFMVVAGAGLTAAYFAQADASYSVAAALVEATSWVLPGVIGYISAFAITAYLRQRKWLGSFNDHPDRWLSTVFYAGIFSTIVTVFLCAIAFVPLGGLTAIIYNSDTLLIFLVQTFLICGFASFFGLIYIEGSINSNRDANNSLGASPTGAGGVPTKARWRARISQSTMIAAHATIATIIVVVMTVGLAAESVYQRPIALQDGALDALKQTKGSVTENSRGSFPYVYPNAALQDIWNDLVVIQKPWSPTTQQGMPLVEQARQRRESLEKVCSKLGDCKRSRKPAAPIGNKSASNAGIVLVNEATPAQIDKDECQQTAKPNPCSYTTIFNVVSDRFNFDEAVSTQDPVLSRDIANVQRLVNHLGALHQSYKDVEEFHPRNKLLLPVLGSVLLCIAFGFSCSVYGAHASYPPDVGGIPPGASSPAGEGKTGDGENPRAATADPALSAPPQETTDGETDRSPSRPAIDSPEPEARG